MKIINYIKLALLKGAFLAAITSGLSVSAQAQLKIPLHGEMGSFQGVPAYSNGTSSRTSTVYNYVNDVVTGQSYNTGFQWQCVEYVNRYYLLNQKMKIRIAGTNAIDYYGTASQRGLVAYPNGGTVAPQAGDIMCFSGNTYGHVSVCRSLASQTVSVIQQNASCTSRDANFAHPMTVKNGRYTVSGKSLGSQYVCQGWLRKSSSGSGTGAGTGSGTGTGSGVGSQEFIPAKLSSPVDGSVFTSDKAYFAWNAAPGALEYWIHLGTAPGGFEYYGGTMGVNTGTSFSGLPSDGSKLHMRLFTRFSSGWKYNDFIFTCYKPVSSGLGNPGEIYFPGNGETLVGPEPTFMWNHLSGALEYFFYMGNSIGANDIYGNTVGVNTYVNLIGVPRDGRLLYVTLWIRTSAGWSAKYYTYRARNW